MLQLALQETVSCNSAFNYILFLQKEDPLEKEMATHSSTLAWKIPWTEKPGRLQSTGVAKSGTQLSDFPLAIEQENSNC